MYDNVQDKYAAYGADSTSDAELLACVTRLKVNLVQSALDRCSGMQGMRRMHVQDMIACGVKKAHAIAFHAAFAVAKRAQRYVCNYFRIESPAQVADYIREDFRGREQEEFHVLLLNVRHGVIHSERITIGLLDRSQVHAREVFRLAIRYGAARMILVHNHPSGDVTPSRADIEMTRALVSAGKLIGIEIIDHVIIGERMPNQPQDWYSFKDANLLS